MKTHLKVIFVFLIIASLKKLEAQNQSAKYILKAVYTKMMLAKDYTVQANIKVDLPFVRMLPIDAKIYFKQQEKFKVESKSIAIVPRQGFYQLTKMLIDTTTFDALISGSEKINETLTSILNIIPSSDTSDLILGKLWIDVDNKRVVKSQLTTKSNGTILTEYSYGSQINYSLPDKMIFTVDIKKFKIPKSVAADINNSKTKEEDKTKKENKGKIIITLTNYEINKGIKDEVFKK